MNEIYLFSFFLLLGWVLRKQLSHKQKSHLKLTTYLILLAFVSASLWINGLPADASILLLVGGLLQIIPSLFGVLVKNNSYRTSFLLFGTYGGGSRGMLALSILSPALLPIFIIIDLGNFLALILFYPLLLKLGLRKEHNQTIEKSNYYTLLISLTVIAISLLLNKYVTSFNITTTHIFLKYLLIALTSFQIGVYLSINLKCILWTFKSILIVRFMAILMPLLLIFCLSPNGKNDIYIVIFLFSVLPVSSIAVSLLPQNADSSFQESLSCAVTASTLIFISIVMVISLF